MDDLPEPWRVVEDHAEQVQLAGAMAGETPWGHPLHGAGPVPLARREDTDDVLFALPDGRVIEVRLALSEPAGAAGFAPLEFSDLSAWYRFTAGV